MTATSDKARLPVVQTLIKLLTFRITRDELLSLDRRHLLAGLFLTWIVGIGRYWDDSRATLVQHLGLGSVIYVFLLALLLFLIAWPLRPAGWSYVRVLTFVTMVSPPALLYAIPVERWFTVGTANTLNAWFLALVAAWRLALLIFFLRRHAQMGPLSIAVAGLLPVTLIVTALATLNVERAVFDLMGGRHEPTPNDSAYVILAVLTYLSFLIFIPLVLTYIILAVLQLTGKVPAGIHDSAVTERSPDEIHLSDQKSDHE